MRPSCKKCNGFLEKTSYTTQEDFGIDSIRCINCGWLIQKGEHENDITFSPTFSDFD